ncbi:glycosyltransferase [Halomonas sp. ML-15]|uniref:glycosyltransferase n=1 Tax=Halomonas sp. ML-15 TaxID=2773305 RepID=UPI0017473E5A|nr:glycosyltransferase [Halomonas sp. ML-15]MBD3894573.1 glycosyltransferase [Halomonas sp. ML-15]
MRIAVVVTQYEAGGAQKAAINLANGLVRAGCSPTLIFLYKKAEADFHIEPGVVVEYLLPEKRPISLLLLSLPRLVRTLRRAGAERIIAFTHYANLYSAMAGKLLGVPVVVSHRNPLFSYGRLTRLADRWLAMLGCLGTVTYVSGAVRDSFGDHYAGVTLRHKVIYNCIDRQDDSQLPSPPEGNYLLAVGRLSEQKNHALLIEALARSRYTGDLVILGEGECRAALEALAERLGVASRVKMPGVKSNAEVNAWLRGAKAFYMPSRYEGMSNALLEAIVSRTYTVVSNVPAQVEAVTAMEGTYGEVLDIDDIDAWSASMDAMRDDLQPPAEIADALAKRYSFERFMADFQSLLPDAPDALGRDAG